MALWTYLTYSTAFLLQAVVQAVVQATAQAVAQDFVRYRGAPFRGLACLCVVRRAGFNDTNSANVVGGGIKKAKTSRVNECYQYQVGKIVPQLPSTLLPQNVCHSKGLKDELT